MDAASSSGVGSPESSLDYSFGFDNVNFSDRTLLLQINDDQPDSDSDDQVLDDVIAPRVKAIHINSLILAAQSPFFNKLFSNGMKESQQRQVTLQIEAEEEVSFMDLLNYVYSKKLPTTLFPLLDLLEIADKFEVASCFRACSRSLQNLPMTIESASHYVNIPPYYLMSHTIQPLIHAAKQFLVAHFTDIERSKEELLKLPLPGIQAVLSSDSLRVASECVVYDLVLMWARKHYPNLESRRAILKSNLLNLIRFPLMTTAKLTEEVLTCTDIDPELSSKIVIQALHFKAETPHRQRCLAAEENNAASRQYVERAYTFRPVKVVEFELTHQRCTNVYLDLKREEMLRIFPNGRIFSETFNLGGKEMSFVGQCFLDRQTNIHSFWLSLLMQVAGSAAYTVSVDVALRIKPSEEFVCNFRRNHTFTEGAGSCVSPLCLNWSVLLADNSPYFINGTLQLRADLKINK